MWFNKKYIQFSKIMIAGFSMMWYIMSFFGMVYVWIKGEGFGDLLLFVGIPMTGGVVSYYINSAIEKKNRKGDTENANEVI